LFYDYALLEEVEKQSKHAQAVKITKEGKIYVKRENPSLNKAVQHPVG